MVCCSQMFGKVTLHAVCISSGPKDSESLSMHIYGHVKQLLDGLRAEASKPGACMASVI